MKYLIILFIGFALSVNLHGQNDANKKRKQIFELFSKANIARTNGDTLSAINILNQVFTINPNDTNAYGQLGIIYGNTNSRYFNKKLALDNYKSCLKFSKLEKNKEKLRAEIKRLEQILDTSSKIHQNDNIESFISSETEKLDHGIDIISTDVKNEDDEFSSLLQRYSIGQSDLDKTDIIVDEEPEILDSDTDFFKEIVGEVGEDVTQTDSHTAPVTLLNDTLLTYINTFDILKEDVKALKVSDCPKKDGTQYVSALFNHETGRDAIVLLFDDKGCISLHKDCDLMVGFREIIKKEKIDYSNQIVVSSDTSKDIWIVNIELNLPDSVLNNPSWGKNVYRMVGIYFNQYVEIAPDQIKQINQICQKGKTLKISYKFTLEPINGLLYGKSVICAEKTDGCKYMLAYSRTNQLFGLANDEYRIKETNIENIQKLNIDAESAQSAYEQYLEFSTFHQQTKNEDKYYTEYVNRVNALSSLNQPEALFTSYIANQYGLWKIKKSPFSKRFANQCKDKIISMQNYLKKNNW